MKIIGQKHIDHADLAAGQFNNCQHTFLECEFGTWQTISVKLPNGKHVTFAFCPASTPGEVECVDIHTTAGKAYVNGNKATSWQQRTPAWSRCCSIPSTIPRSQFNFVSIARAAAASG